MNEKQLRDAIRQVKTDPRWKLKWCERFGDAYTGWHDCLSNGIRGIGYNFPFQRTVKGREINECENEGWFVVVGVNSYTQRIYLHVPGHRGMKEMEYPEIAEAIEQFAEIE